jgi:hypothetical protein
MHATCVGVSAGKEGRSLSKRCAGLQSVSGSGLIAAIRPRSRRAVLDRRDDDIRMTSLLAMSWR